MTAPASHPPEPQQRQAHLSVAERPAPAPLPAGERIRKELEDALFQGRRFAEETWDDLRRRDRFFRWKAAILAAWIAVSALSLRIATSGPEDPASNGLRAYVAITHTSMSWALLVHNRSDEPWTEVRVLLDGGFVHERQQIGPDEKVVLSPAQFVDAAGEPAPLDLAVQGVRVVTDEGSARPPLVR